jgi:predicted amidophosphoribosyltransferase
LIDLQERCNRCFALLDDQVKLCSRCFQDPPSFQSAASAFEAEGSPFSLIKEFKKEQREDFAKDLASFLVVQLSRLNWPYPELLIPIPTPPLSRFSPSLQIAKGFSALTQIPILKALKIQKSHLPQSKLPFLEREKLSPETFTLKTNASLCDKTLLLVDDLMATRMTLRRCAEALAPAFPKKIYALTFCCYD